MLPRVASILAVLVLFYAVADRYVSNFFVFDPKRLQEISQSVIAKHGNDTTALLRDLTSELQSEYGGAVVDWTKGDWFFNNAGGAMVMFHPASCLWRRRRY